jgi:hypothetical protein
MNRKITAPRKTNIKGQPHQLAYINDAEQGLLLALGGAGKPVHGVPAYFDVGEGDFGYDSGGNSADTAGGRGDPDGNDYGGNDADEQGDAIAEAAAAAAAAVSAAQNTMNRADARNYGTPNPSAQDIEAARGFDFGSAASDALANSFGQGFNQMGAGLGYNVSGLELDRAFGQLNDRMANAKANYGLPSLAGSLFGAIGMNNLENMKSNLEKGHMPAFDAKGNFQGTFGPDPFGFGGVVYSGNPIEGNEATGYSSGGDGDQEEIRPVNPLTGTCEDGYIFDDDLNACRLATESGSDSDGGNGNSNPDGLYFQRSILDDAPQFMPAGMDFDEMNRNFRRAAAYNPDNYENQMNTTGFSLLT